MSILKYVDQDDGWTFEKLAKELGTIPNGPDAGTDATNIVKFFNEREGLAAAETRVSFQCIVQQHGPGKIFVVCFEAYPHHEHPDGNFARKADGSPHWPVLDDCGHYSVVVAADKRGVWLMDPFAQQNASGVLPRVFIPRAEFMERFYDHPKRDGDAIVVDVSSCGIPRKRSYTGSVQRLADHSRTV